MITSQEINAMISMQQQQAGYMGGVPMAVPMSGASQYPPQFNYAPRPMGAAQLGQAAAGGLMNSFGPTAGGMTNMAMNIGMAAGVGGWAANKMGFAGAGNALGSLAGNRFLTGVSNLNPMNAAFSGAWGAGEAAVASGGWGSLLTGAGARSIALGAAEGILASPAAMIGIAAAPIAIGMHRGAQQYSQTASMLGAYNQFANPFASTGRGFSENQMSSIVSGMRALQANDPFLSMRDMQQAMSRFNEMGMNQGERDAEQVMKKFTAMTKSMQAMSKMMGTTMDEASKVFAQMRGVGFYSGADVMQNTLLGGTMRGQGISGNTMLGAQAAGGGISRAGGLGTTPGAKSVGGVMAMLTGGRGVGALTNEEMMNITGAATPDQAIAQLSTTMAGSLTGFYTQTGVGQAMLAALGETNARGEFTGGLDSEAIEGLRTGRIDINNLVSKGRGKVSTRNAALSFKTRGQDVAGALISEGDPTAAIGAIMQSVAGDKFRDMDPENLVTLLTERIQGLGRKEAEAMTKLYREGEKIRRESQQQIRAEMQAGIFSTDIREYHSLEGYKRRVLGGLSDRFTPILEAGQALSVMGGRMTERASDAIFGVTRVRTGNDVVDARLERLSEGRFDESATGAVDKGMADTTLSGLLRRRDYVGATAEFNKTDSRVRAGKNLNDLFGSPDAAGRQVVAGSLGMKLINYSSDIRAGKSAADIVRGMRLEVPEAGGIDQLLGSTDTLSIEEYLAGGADTLGGTSAERRQALVDEAMSLGRPEVAALIADMGVGNTRSLEQIKSSGTDILNKYGYVNSYTARSGYDKLMESESLGAAGRLGKAGVDLSSFYKMTQEAYGGAGVTNQSQGYGRLLDALRAKGVDVAGMTKTQLDALMEVAQDTGAGLGESLTAADLMSLGEGASAAQSQMDLANLTAMATAASESAYEGISNAAGADELAALAGSSTETDVAKNTSALLDTLEKAIGSGDLTLGDIGKEGSRYGAFGKTLAQLLQTRKSIAAVGAGEVSDADRKALLGMGFSEKYISSLGTDIDGGELVKLQTGAEQRRLAELTGGGTAGAFTDTTQAEAVKYYDSLAKSVVVVNDQVLRMQDREQAYQAQRAAAPLKPEE